MSNKEEIADMYKVEPEITSIKPSGYFTDDVLKAYAEANGVKQVGGNHYVAHTIQPWDIIDDWNLDYYLGNVIKYVLRDKNDKVEDLQKAIHYLEKKIELLEKE